MATLINKSKNITLLQNLDIANSFAMRAIGFIGKPKHDNNHGIYFPRCNWIHTFFMSFPIDVVYVDQSMVVKKIDFQLKPWRMPAPVFSAHAVIEMRAGLAKNRIEVGDSLHVGH